MSAFENRFNEIFVSGRIGQPGYPSHAKTEAEHTITHLTRQLEIAREALGRQCDNMAFIINHDGFPQDCFDKPRFQSELRADRQALSQLDKREGDA